MNYTLPTASISFEGWLAVAALFVSTLALALWLFDRALSFYRSPVAPLDARYVTSPQASWVGHSISCRILVRSLSLRNLRFRIGLQEFGDSALPAGTRQTGRWTIRRETDGIRFAVGESIELTGLDAHVFSIEAKALYHGVAKIEPEVRIGAPDSYFKNPELAPFHYAIMDEGHDSVMLPGPAL